MSLIIGVIGRPNDEEKKIMFSKPITDVIINNGCVPLGIIAPTTSIYRKMNMKELKNLYLMIDMCDGIILQGGNDYYNYDIESIKYIIKNDIPLLGICLGMQSIGAFFGASLTTISDHNQPEVDFVHPIIIEPKSKLYQIIKNDKILVNSRHKEMIINPKDIDVSARYNGVIEAVEKKNKTFCIGVQWHPEDMYKYDEDSIKLFKAFFKTCKTSKLQKM